MGTRKRRQALPFRALAGAPRGPSCPPRPRRAALGRPLSLGGGPRSKALGRVLSLRPPQRPWTRGATRKKTVLPSPLPPPTLPPAPPSSWRKVSSGCGLVRSCLGAGVCGLLRAPLAARGPAWFCPERKSRGAVAPTLMRSLETSTGPLLSSPGRLRSRVGSLLGPVRPHRCLRDVSRPGGRTDLGAGTRVCRWCRSRPLLASPQPPCAQTPACLRAPGLRGRLDLPCSSVRGGGPASRPAEPPPCVCGQWPVRLSLGLVCGASRACRGVRLPFLPPCVHQNGSAILLP